MIKIEEKAYLYIKNLKSNLLVEIIKGGCFGSRYKFSSVFDEFYEDCELVKFNDFIVFIKKQSLLFIIGSQLVLFETSTGSRLSFINPNVKKECGCNKSVLV